MRPARVLVLPALMLGLLAATPAVGQASPEPVLRVNGETLKWTAAGTHDVYRLLTDAPDGRTVSTVLGRTTTPPPVPGATISYRVKAAYNESAWSNEVSITYAPAEESGKPPEDGEPPPTESEQ